MDNLTKKIEEYPYCLDFYAWWHKLEECCQDSITSRTLQRLKGKIFEDWKANHEKWMKQFYNDSEVFNSMDQPAQVQSGVYDFMEKRNMLWHQRDKKDKE